MNNPDCEANLTLVRRYFDAVNARDLDAIASLFAPVYVFHGDAPDAPRTLDPRDVQQAIAALHGAFSDLRMEIQAVVADVRHVAARWVASGTHTGAYLGLPASGRAGRMTGMFLWRVEDGRFAEGWSNQDDVSLLRDAAAPTPQGGRP